jgi:hypothetical protein
MLYSDLHCSERASPRAVNCAVAVALHFALYRKKRDSFLTFLLSHTPNFLYHNALRVSVVEREKKAICMNNTKNAFHRFLSLSSTYIPRREQKKINVDISFSFSARVAHKTQKE